MNKEFATELFWILIYLDLLLRIMFMYVPICFSIRFSLHIGSGQELLELKLIETARIYFE